MLLNRAYYATKPFIPWALRIGLRRWLAIRRRAAFRHTWPIDPRSGEAPKNWAGWPEGKRFAFVLTHDVEGQIGLGRCRMLAELDQSLGFRAAFNFVPEGEYKTPSGLREWLQGRGFEVGVHDLKHDGKLYRSRAAFQKHAREINGYLKEWGATGFRSGFMHHQLDWLHDLDIAYDSSTFDTDPFEPQPDGVNTIFPFWVSNPAGRNSGYVELPYTLPQDFTLFVVLRESGIDIWKQKLEWIASRGGMALLPVHPDYVCFDGKKSRSEFPVSYYTEFLEHVRARYGGAFWQALPREVAEHVVETKQSCMSEGSRKPLARSA